MAGNEVALLSLKELLELHGGKTGKEWVRGRALSQAKETWDEFVVLYGTPDPEDEPPQEEFVKKVFDLMNKLGLAQEDFSKRKFDELPEQVQMLFIEEEIKSVRSKVH